MGTVEDGAGRLAVARAAVHAVHAAHGRAVPPDLLAAGGSSRRSAGVVPLPAAHEDHSHGAWADQPPWIALGLAHEAGLPEAARSAGAHYTPLAVAAGLVALTGLADERRRPEVPAGAAGPRVWDPACGGGVFLLAAADALYAGGRDPGLIVSELLWGSDLDPGAVAVTEAALVWWAGDHGAPDARPGRHLVVADSLLAARPGPPEGFDAVLGNPPFHGQLAAGNVRGAGRRAELRRRFGPALGAYTDTAALFWLLAARALRPGGRAALVLPTSVLSARDARPVRDAIVEVAELTDLWAAGEAVFEASVEVCAPVVRRRDAPGSGSRRTGSVRRWRGSSFARLADADTPPVGSSWSPLLLAALGVPEPRYRSAGRLGDRAVAFAGFRDEYYGLVGHVTDLGPGDGGAPAGCSPLVTTGLVDVGTCHWGDRPVRFAGTRYHRPVVDRAGVLAGGGRAAAWLTTTAGPKVVVGTQTRVGEAAVDEAGHWVPGTPLVVLLPPSGRLGGDRPPDDERRDPVAVEELWRWAAVVCSPVGSAVLLAETAGSGRSRHTIRPRAATLVDLPLPLDLDAWSAGAVALRSGDREGFVDAMSAAYAVAEPSPLADWWRPLAPWPTRPPTP